jgi:hypothetical protein
MWWSLISKLWDLCPRQNPLFYLFSGIKSMEPSLSPVKKINVAPVNNTFSSRKLKRLLPIVIIVTYKLCTESSGKPGNILQDSVSSGFFR